MGKPIIEFKNVTKRFRLFRGEGQRIIFLFNRNVKCRKKVAVDNVSFSINKGERVAIIGKNGAGKTTILKMITGVCYPTEGEIKVRGKLSAIQELQVGFDSEFTGRENIWFRCQLYGMTDDEIREIEQEVIDFAELGYYIDQPVRTYTNGMRMKLGFAINVSLKPEVIIADEVLSVGDAPFKKKCLKKIRKLTEKDNITFLFVTHTSGTAKKFCERGIFLQDGKIIFDGDIEKAIELYKESISDKKKIQETETKDDEVSLVDQQVLEERAGNPTEEYDGMGGYYGTNDSQNYEGLF